MAPTAQILYLGTGFEVLAPRGFVLSIGWGHSRVVKTRVEADHVAKYLTPCRCGDCVEGGKGKTR